MTRRLTKSTRRQSELARKMTSDFDAAVLKNHVHDVISEDSQLAQLLDAWAHTTAAADQREATLDYDHAERTYDAASELSDVARERAREAVANACATVLEDGDQWVEDGSYDRDRVDAAQADAREWLQTYTNVATRLNLLTEVTE